MKWIGFIDFYLANDALQFTDFLQNKHNRVRRSSLLIQFEPQELHTNLFILNFPSLLTQKAAKQNKTHSFTLYLLLDFEMQYASTVNQKQKLKRMSEKFQKYFLFPFKMQVVQCIWKCITSNAMQYSGNLCVEKVTWFSIRLINSKEKKCGDEKPTTTENCA